MGNNLKQENYEMNIELIGDNLEIFKESISKAKAINNIQKFWKINYNKYQTIESQINSYFNKLQGIKKGHDKTIDLKECLIVKIKNLSDHEVTLILEKINLLGQLQYMPLVLFLLDNDFDYNMKIEIDKNKYKRIDPRLISILKYNENSSEEIELKLIRFFSIHNELGDRFTIGEGNNAEDFDLIELYYPFNINIACIGRFGQGKSTGVNAILKEYKAKESSKGSSQTKNLTFYQVNKQPIRILDIPGFEDQETIKKAVEKFKQCGERINKIKDNLHIVLYFLNYNEDRLFSRMELPMIEELCNHKSSKIIYVITHSNPKMDEEDKEEKIRNINEGLQNVTKNNSNIYKETELGGLLYASSENVVFVNFHRDNKTGFEEFGIENLFQTIYNHFVETEDYINSTKTINNDDYIQKQAEKLRAQAEDVLFSHKIWGGLVGIIPGLDLFIQKFLIKKDAAKKVAQIYGIDIKYIGNVKQNNNTDNHKPEYISDSVDKEQLKLKVKAEEIMNTKTTNLQIAASYGAQYLCIFGRGAMLPVASIFGASAGAYLTHQYCEELIDKFESYYKSNALKIANSYKQAIQYLLIK